MFTPGVKAIKMTHLYHLTLSDETHCGNCPWPSVMVFQGCHHKIPLTGWLKTTKMYCLPVPEARSSKSRYWQGCFLLRVNLLHTSLLTSRGLKTNLWSFLDLQVHHRVLCLHLRMVFLLSLHIVFPLPRSVSEHPLFIRISVILD